MIKNYYNIKDEFGRRKLPTKRLARKRGSVTRLARKPRLVGKAPIGLEKTSNERGGPTTVPYQSGAAKHCSGENSGDRTVSGEARSNKFDCESQN